MTSWLRSLFVNVLVLLITMLPERVVGELINKTIFMKFGDEPDEWPDNDYNDDEEDDPDATDPYEDEDVTPCERSDSPDCFLCGDTECELHPRHERREAGDIG